MYLPSRLKGTRIAHVPLRDTAPLFETTSSNGLGSCLSCSSLVVGNRNGYSFLNLGTENSRSWDSESGLDVDHLRKRSGETAKRGGSE
jgi:hypothetical protein